MMKLLRSVLGLILIIPAFGTSPAAGATAGPGPTLEIPAEIVVPGPKITMADLGRLSGAGEAELRFLQGIGLGMAPPPGAERVFNRSYLEFVLRQHPQRQELRLKMGEKVVVRIESFHIKGSELAAVIEGLLPPKPPGVTRQWVEYRNLPEELWLAKGDWKVEAASVGKIPELGRTLFKVKLSNGAASKEMNIAAVIKKTALVYRVIRNIPFHTGLNPADFEKAEVTLVNGKEYVGDFPEGYRNIRAFRSGQILEDGAIQPVPLVQKGMEVTVLARGNGVEISLRGIAKKDGWLGDRIVLANPVSKKEFKGRVTGKSCVEVAIE
jgi:flagella basal body P-ring formation protein FlgA